MENRQRDRDDERPRDSDPSDMTDFEKNVAHGELELLEDEQPPSTPDITAPRPKGTPRRPGG